MSKPVILTGLRANNDLHIGNYFGALLPLVDMAKNRADDYQINLFVPDLHSFTTPIDHSQLQAQILHNVKLFAAAGLPLDNENIHIYRQSYVPAHSELTWILDCFTGFGQLNRMTQFKDKSSQKALDHEEEQLLGEWKKIHNQTKFSETTESYRSKYGKFLEAFDDVPLIQGEMKVESTAELLEDHPELAIAAYETLDRLLLINKFRDIGLSFSTIGLFNYPVLMAADILLYDAQYVPVGDDQSQHLEFTRDVAERMNNKFGNLFVVPEAVKKQHEFFNKDQGLRIKDLVDPSRKMSKSEASDRGVIFLGDSPEEAAKKVMGATTDNEGKVHLDFEKQPGVSNLLQIHALLSGETLQAVAEHHDGQKSYGDLKKEVADEVKEFLTDFQAKLAAVDEEHVMLKLQSSEAKMNDTANKKLIEVQKAVGLR
jgi:tryptophanyl-tRNA synthetase